MKITYRAVMAGMFVPVIFSACTAQAPLLTDVFFKDMAVVIMFGLGFASVLTLVVVPVLYAIFFRVKTNEQVV